MSKTIKQIKTAEIGFGGREDILATGGIGSCVVVCLWAASMRLGALAHIMLPDSSSHDGDFSSRPGISPDIAVPRLLLNLRNKTASGLITAKLIGGGNMFAAFHEDGIMGETPKGIIRNTKELLSRESIAVIAECLGGTLGRRLEFDVETGQVFIENVSGETKRI